MAKGAKSKDRFWYYVILALLGSILIIAHTVFYAGASRGMPDGGASGHQGFLQEKAVIARLDRYAEVVKNLTHRIDMAEAALQRALEARPPQKQRERAPPVAPAAPVEASQESPAGDGDEDDDEKEQKKLIEYDPGTGTFKRWRADYKCGDGAPMLPDGERVECEPRSEFPCCSALGWCGKTRGHCNCPSCIDYNSRTKPP